MRDDLDRTATAIAELEQQIASLNEALSYAVKKERMLYAFLQQSFGRDLRESVTVIRGMTQWLVHDPPEAQRYAPHAIVYRSRIIEHQISDVLLGTFTDAGDAGLSSRFDSLATLLPDIAAAGAQIVQHANAQGPDMPVTMRDACTPPYPDLAVDIAVIERVLHCVLHSIEQTPLLTQVILATEGKADHLSIRIRWTCRGSLTYITEHYHQFAAAPTAFAFVGCVFPLYLAWILMRHHGGDMHITVEETDTCTVIVVIPTR